MSYNSHLFISSQTSEKGGEVDAAAYHDSSMYGSNFLQYSKIEKKIYIEQEFQVTKSM